MRKLILVLAIAGRAYAMQYPSNAGVINVTLSPYSANNACGSDATTAFRSAIQAAGAGQIVYAPNGCYTITKTIWWNKNPALPDPPAAGDAKNFVQLIGQSKAGVTLKVPNNTAYFGSTTGCTPGTYAGYVLAGGTGCRAVLYTASSFNSGASSGIFGFGEDAYMVNIMDLTIEIGTGNPGAIGIDATGSNTAAIRNVQITDDGGGSNALIGLALTRTQSGPAYVQNVTVSGFKYGGASGSPNAGFAPVWNSWTMEHISVSGQGVAGWYNINQPMFVNGFTSVNSVVAFQNNAAGRPTIINASLTGGSGSISAIQNPTSGAVLFLRGITCSGYASCLNNNGTVVAGNTISEYTSKTPQSQFPSIGVSLNLPTTDAPTYTNTNFATDWADVTSGTYGSCVANAVFDCTSAIQNAMNSGKPVVYFPMPSNSDNNNYKIKGTVTIPSTVRLVEGVGSCLTGFNNGSTCLTQRGNFTNENTPFVCPAGCNVIFDNFNIDKTTLGVWTNTGGTETQRDIFNTTHYQQTCSSCTTYFEDAAVTGVNIAGGNFLCRQCDFETSRNHIIFTNNATGWMLGYKIEGGATGSGCTAPINGGAPLSTDCAIMNAQNSTVEVLGTFFQSNSAGTAFIMVNSQVSIANPSTLGNVYTNDFAESRAGSVYRILNDTSFSGGIGLALYSGNTFTFNPTPPGPCGIFGAFTVVQCNSVLTPAGGSSASTISATYPQAIQAGDTLLACPGYYNGSVVTNTITDTLMNTWTPITIRTIFDGGNFIAIQAFVAANSPAGNDTVLDTFGTFPTLTGFPVMQIFDVKGTPSASLITSSGSTTNVATASSGSLSTVVPALILSCINAESHPSGVGAGMTLLQNPLGQVAAGAAATISSGSFTSTYTLPGAPFFAATTQVALGMQTVNPPAAGNIISQ